MVPCGLPVQRGISPTPYAAKTERALAIAAKVASKYRNALRESAKQPMRRGARERIWVERPVVDAVHFDLLRAHGGLPLVRCSPSATHIRIREIGLGATIINPYSSCGRPWHRIKRKLEPAMQG